MVGERGLIAFGVLGSWAAPTTHPQHMTTAGNSMMPLWACTVSRRYGHEYAKDSKLVLKNRLTPFWAITSSAENCLAVCDLQSGSTSSPSDRSPSTSFIRRRGRLDATLPIVTLRFDAYVR